MNVMLQRHCARYIYVVPDGLKELLSDISREVIRTQPQNIYTFIADYLDALLITRENARVAARLVQSITEIAVTTAEFLISTGMDRVETDRVISIVQKTFKKHLYPSITGLDQSDISEEIEEKNIVSDIINQANILPEEGEEAARIIQNAYRRFKAKQEQERELLKGMIDWRAAARSAIHLYRKTGVTYEEANRAATLIKAAYKGYYTRRFMKKLAEKTRILSEDYRSDEDEDVLFEHDQKIVTINYGSIIPHVDFNEPKLSMEKEITEAIIDESQIIKAESSDSDTRVHAVLDEVIDMTFDEIHKKETEIKVLHKSRLSQSLSRDTEELSDHIEILEQVVEVQEVQRLPIETEEVVADQNLESAAENVEETVEVPKAEEIEDSQTAQEKEELPKSEEKVEEPAQADETVEEAPKTEENVEGLKVEETVDEPAKAEEKEAVIEKSEDVPVEGLKPEEIEAEKVDAEKIEVKETEAEPAE